MIIKVTCVLQEKKRVEVKCSGYLGTIKRNFVEEEDTRRSIKGNGFVQAEKSQSLATQCVQNTVVTFYLY